MTIEEERRLIECVELFDPVIASYAAVLGETGLRKSEGLRLRWSHIDLAGRQLSVGLSKSGKVRHVPLTEFAYQWLSALVRYVGQDCVFLAILREAPGRTLADLSRREPRKRA